MQGTIRFETEGGSVFNLRPAALKDAIDISPHLSKSDVAEIKAASGRDPEEALVSSFSLSDTCLTATLDETPVMICGLVRHNETMGILWLFVTDDFHKIAHELAPAWESLVESFLEMYPVLFNAVDKRNTKAIDWLKGLGFEFLDAVPEFGAGKLPFIPFVRYKKDV